MLDLSSLAPRKMPYWYELHLQKHKDLDRFALDAHIQSMLHSQKKDYGAKLRVVLCDDDIKHPRQDYATLDAFLGTPGLEVAMRVADEVVVRLRRLPTNEFVLKPNEGKANILRKRVNEYGERAGTPAPLAGGDKLPVDPAAQVVEVKSAPSGRAWSFDD